MQTPIENAEDLASQTKIAYGVQRGGSTENFFRVRRSLFNIPSDRSLFVFNQESKLPTYERMWNYISANQAAVSVASSTDGITRVSEGNYAFLIE